MNCYHICFTRETLLHNFQPIPNGNFLARSEWNHMNRADDKAQNIPLVPKELPFRLAFVICSMMLSE